MVTTFLVEEDYRTVCGLSAVELLSQSSEDNRLRAEQYALEEAASYLRGRYDMTAAYAAVGAARNAQLVMLVVDIALYHLASWLPKRQGWDIRQIRYESALEWLRNAQAGKTAPDLPPLTDSDGNDAGNPIRYGSLPKQTYNW